MAPFNIFVLLSIKKKKKEKMKKGRKRKGKSKKGSTKALKLLPQLAPKEKMESRGVYTQHRTTVD